MPLLRCLHRADANRRGLGIAGMERRSGWRQPCCRKNRTALRLILFFIALGGVQDLRVFGTVGRAYGFLFREFGTILRLSWLPLLLLTIVQYFVGLAIIQPIADDPTDLSGMFTSPSGMLGSLTNLLAYTAGTAVVAVALHRVILFGARRPGQYFYLSFGRTEWLFMATLLSAYLASVLLFGAIFYLMPPWLTMLLSLFLFVTVIYLWVRLSLIFPVIVAEGRYDFGQARAITRDRFWRLFGLWLVVFVPILLVSSIVQPLVAFGSFRATPELLATHAQDVPTHIKLSVMSFVLTLVSGALGVAVLSYAYKALSGRGPDDIVTPKASSGGQS